MDSENFVNRAFNNCSEKIKKLAKIFFCIGLVAGVITAIALFIVASNTWGDGTLFIVLGIASIIVVPLLTWISCLFLYGLGELIEKARDIEKNTKNRETLKVDKNQIGNYSKNEEEKKKEVIKPKKVEDSNEKLGMIVKMGAHIIAECDICGEEKMTVPCTVINNLGVDVERNICANCVCDHFCIDKSSM